MKVRPSNQSHDRNSQFGTTIDRCSPARSTGGAWRMDRELDGETAAVLHGGYFHWGWPVRRRYGVVACARTRTYRGHQVPAHYSTDHSWKRAAQWNVSS